MVFEKLHRRLQHQDLIKPSAIIIIGLSGGPDSVFLLHFLVWLRTQMPLTLIAAHLNHGWRQEAGEDERFCRRLAQSLAVEYHSAHFNDIKHTLKATGSREDVGRQARRLFFEQLAATHHADAIALAHHANDQQETFFIRLLRGATITGLSSMRPRHGLYIRPLLGIYKTEILAYLHEHAIAYRIDSSNEQRDFLRNRIRSLVIPALHAADPRFDNTFARTLASLQETDRFVEELAHTTLQNSSCTDATYGAGLVLKKLFACDPVLRDRIIMQWLQLHDVPFTPQSAFIAEIVRFLQSERGGTHQLHEQWQIIKKRGNAYIQTRT